MSHRNHDGKLPVDGEELRTIREAHGLTRAQLAESAKSTEKTVRLMETNPEYRANPVSINELARALNVTASRLVHQKVTAPPRIIRSSEEVIHWNTEIAL